MLPYQMIFKDLWVRRDLSGAHKDSGLNSGLTDPKSARNAQPQSSRRASVFQSSPVEIKGLLLSQCQGRWEFSLGVESEAQHISVFALSYILWLLWAEVEDSPSLEVSKVRLDGVLSNLEWWKVSLPEGGTGWALGSLPSQTML